MTGFFPPKGFTFKMSLCSCSLSLHLVINILCRCALAALMKCLFLTFLSSISPAFLWCVFIGWVMKYGSVNSFSLHRRCDDSRVMSQIRAVPTHRMLISLDWHSPPFHYRFRANATRHTSTFQDVQESDYCSCL